MKKWIKNKKYWLYVIIVVSCMYISSCYYQFVLIQGSSMYPTYHNLQLVILKKNIHEIKNGNVIAFRYGKKKNVILIKRVVAQPGDIVEIKNGYLFVNNVKSVHMREDESIFPSGDIRYPVLLSDNEYFVLGDNYKESKDSRYTEIGLIKQEDILGTVIE